MNKEKLVQFLSDAIDSGANLHLLFYGHGENKEIAEKRIKEFSEIIGSTEIKEHETISNRWLTTESNFKASMSHFYDVVPSHFMEEDVDLTGGVEDVG